MKISRPLTSLAVVALMGCGGSQSAAPAAAAAPTQIAADASAFSSDGFSISRPDGWEFLPVDESVGPDTVVLLQGPIGEATLAPAVEVTRRQLNASQRRRKPAHILTQMVTEIVQLFEGFEMVGQPVELELGGQPGAVIELTYTESLPDGAEVKRAGKFYGVVNGSDIWVIRCMGSDDGASDADFQTIIGSIEIG